VLGLVKESKFLEIEGKLNNLLQENTVLKRSGAEKESKFLELEGKLNNLLQENIVLKRSGVEKESKSLEIDEKLNDLLKENITLKQSGVEKEKQLESIKKLKEIMLPEKLEKIQDTINSLSNDVNRKKSELSNLNLEVEYYDEIGSISENIQKFDGMGSDQVRGMIDDNKVLQRFFIKEKKAWKQFGDIEWNYSLRAGKARQNRAAKFMLIAFNAEVDNIIGNVKHSNYVSMHKKIEKWFSRINKYSEDNFIRIEREYLKLRLEELKLVFGYHLQVRFEKEEQRYIQESIREENRVQKEIEEFVKDREKEEKEYANALRFAEEDLKNKAGEEIGILNEEIGRLKRLLEVAVNEKERALSMAQLTRSGYVYIISNKGSFGDEIYKIGMTRRLEPMDRVKELGDASVPFFFDVHGIIQSEDAPGLERKLHKRFEKRRVNKVNCRREFFRVTLEEIEDAVCEIHGEVKLQKVISKNQWDETQELEALLEVEE